MIDEAQLAAELKKRGIHFLANHVDDYGIELDPEILIANLASHLQARFRLSLIPLFLAQPTLSASVCEAMDLLDEPDQVTLACYYTAARLLQQKYRDTLVDILGLQPILPDLFADTLKLEGKTADACLCQLAEQQANQTNHFVNWYGTYHHAYQRFIKTQLHRQRHHA